MHKRGNAFHWQRLTPINAISNGTGQCLVTPRVGVRICLPPDGWP